MTLTIGLLIALIVPAACAYMSIRTGNFYYNLGVTGSCILLLAISPQPLVVIPLFACFLISIVGDYFMSHQQQNGRFYLFGIIGFFLAHACLIWYSAGKVDFTPWLLVVAVALAVGYGAYMAWRALPHVADTIMRVAICAYASISVLALIMGIGMSVDLIPRILYSLGVLSIVISDTIISECDFAGESRFGKLIMPTYFACHLLITASALVRMM